MSANHEILELKEMIQGNAKTLDSIQHQLNLYDIKFVRQEFNLKQAAIYLGYKESTVRNFTCDGHLDFEKKGKFIVFHKSELDRFKEWKRG